MTTPSRVDSIRPLCTWITRFLHFFKTTNQGCRRSGGDCKILSGDATSFSQLKGSRSSLVMKMSLALRFDFEQVFLCLQPSCKAGQLSG